MTQSNRWMGSEMARAPRYSSSVSGFFIRACGNFSALVALGDADLAEILARGAVVLHVVAGDQREARIGPARAVGIDGVLGEAREGRQHAAEGIDLVGVAGDADHELGIAALHGPRRAAQRDDAAGAAQRHVVEPARARAEMLGQADRGVGADGEARQRQAVDVGALEARTLDHLAHRAADPPVSGVGRIAPVRDGDRCGDDDAVVGLPRALIARHLP